MLFSCGRSAFGVSASDCVWWSVRLCVCPSTFIRVHVSMLFHIFSLVSSLVIISAQSHKPGKYIIYLSLLQV